ncbi:MAG: adenosylcobinamide-GDP ribazoletransferase [Candidatus Omnitrophota bacterium]
MIKNIKKHFLIALQFLTIFPVKIKPEIKEKDFGKSLLFFPAIGLVMGFILSGIVFFLGNFPVFLIVAVVLAGSIILTGGLHLDGFADTCDGFYASGSFALDKRKEKALEIMRDSHIGAMGTIGIACVLILKFAFLSSINPVMLWRILPAMFVFSRWALSFSCYLSNYAREEGKAKVFIENANKKEIIGGAVFTLPALLALLGTKGIPIFILAAIVIFLFVQYSKKKIGGITGDTLGAVNEIGEVIFLFLAVVL